MQDKILNIGTPVSLQKLVDTRALIQASSGAGKSWLLRKIMEEASGHVQQIIIDPEGEFITLPEKYDFAIVAKDSGDIPLNLQHANTLAEKILETGVSVVIDIYEYEPYEQRLFVKKFLTALVNAPKALWHPCLIYLDEAHEFASEGKVSESTQAVISLCSKGRKRGFGAILATQRLSKLNKDAAYECLNKFLGQTGGDNDRKRAGEELAFTAKADVLSLRSLDPGDFYAFGPAISKEVIKFHVSQVKTTHLRSGNRLTSIPPTPKAIAKIISQLQNIPQEAEKELETKSQLQNEVRRLSKELTEARRQIGKPLSSPAPVDLKKFVSVEKYNSEIFSLNQQIREKNQQITTLVNENNSLNHSFTNLFATIGKFCAEINKRIEAHNSKAQDGKKINALYLSPIAPTGSAKSTTNTLSNDNRPNSKISDQASDRQKPSAVQNLAKNTNVSADLPSGERVILIRLRQFENGCTRSQLTGLTGYKRSTRDAYILRLSQKGLVEVAKDRILISNDGIIALGDNFQPLPTGSALQEHWKGELPSGEWKVLEILINAHPDPVERDFITEHTGFQRSTRDAYIQRLGYKELIEIVGRGAVKASETLFN